MKIQTLIAIASALILILGGAISYYIFAVLPNTQTSPDSTSQASKEKRIVAFGDSLTYGYNLQSIDDSYPSQLQKKLISEGYNYKVINLGISGDTTADGLARLTAALSYSPDLVLLEFGANDFLQSLSPETAERNLDTMIKAFDDKNIKVLLLNVAPNPLIPLQNKERFTRINEDLSKKYGLSLVPSFLNGILLNSEYTLEDRLHPNKAGYKKALDDNLWPVLERQLLR